MNRYIVYEVKNDEENRRIKYNRTEILDMNAFVDQTKIDKFYDRFAGKIDQWDQNVSQYRERYSLLKALPVKTIIHLIKAGPIVLHLLISLLNHDGISRRTKRLVAGAVGYFIFPLDVIPEGIVGPIGYLDDIVVALLLVDSLLNGDNDEEKTIITDLWKGTEEELAALRAIVKGIDVIRHIGRVVRKYIPA